MWVKNENIRFQIKEFTFENECDMIWSVSLSDNRGCKCRKTAGEESPGFSGQSAG